MHHEVGQNPEGGQLDMDMQKLEKNAVIWGAEARADHIMVYVEAAWLTYLQTQPLSKLMMSKEFWVGWF